MTDERDVGKAVQEPTDGLGAHGQNGPSSLTFGDLSGLLALFGALAYMLGILALWAPIIKNFTLDLAASWYAVSIVPKTTVIGQGLIRLFFPVTIYAGLIAVALYPDYGRKLKGKMWKFALPIIAALIAILVPLTWMVILDFVGREHFVWWEYAVGLISPLPIFLAGLWMKKRVRSRLEYDARRRIIVAERWTTELVRSRFEHDARRRFVIEAVILVLISTSLASFLAFGIIPHRPSLPRVALKPGSDSVEKEKPGSDSVEKGRLLTHGEGYWYIIEPDGEIFAVPDDAGRTADVHPMGF